jgi:D-beta-D-heptose 7-phosphate kinase/D-beta-D-heptose 1-phosphate adenosyltransferase
MPTPQKETVVVVSGGFDPIHIGHIRMIQEARELGDKLVVILNNDHWLRAKKGKIFMQEQDRKEIVEALVGVNEVILTAHDRNDSDRSVCNALAEIMPNVFANGGDRFADDIPEYVFCQKHNIKMVFNVGRGGKIRSSSDLIKKYSNRPKKQKIRG